MTQLVETAKVPGASAARMSWPLIGGAIVFVGVALRVAQYASRQSYWNDEASLVLNIFDKDAQQLFGPLDHDQASPPLFLLAMRGIHLTLGRGEYAMRLLPLVLGIGALILFARLARLTLPPLIAAIALALFALSDNLITHAAEAKQYSVDLFAATLLLLLALRGAPTVPARTRLARVAIVACLAVWFSHPTVFVFGGIALVLGAAALRDRRTNLLPVALAVAGPALSFLSLYFVSIRRQQSQMLFDYWQDKFVPHSWTMPLWLAKSFYGLFDYAYDRCGAVLLPLGVIGVIHLWRSGRRELLGVLVMPILLTLGAAALRRYPFGGTRLTLFLVPGCLLLVGAGLGALRETLPPRVGRWWLALPLALIAVNGAIDAYYLVVPRYRGNMRPVVEHIRAHRQPGEYVFAVRDRELLAYWPQPDEHVVIGEWPETFPRRGRFWVALSFGPGAGDKRRRETPEELRAAAAVSIHEVRGGAALLFDRDVTVPTSDSAND